MKARPSSTQRKLATLSPYEDQCWIFAFCFYSNEGATDLEADRLAWEDLRREFQRLQRFDGIVAPSRSRRS